MMCDKGTSSSASRNRLEDRGLNLHVARVVKHTSHGGDYPIALAENIFNSWIHNQINVALAVAYLRIGKCIVNISVTVCFYNRKWT